MLWAAVGLTAIYLTYLFPTAFSGRNPLTNRICQLSTGIYGGLLLVILTGPLHGLYWRSVSFLETPLPHFTVEYGPGWLAAVVWSFGAVGVFLYYFNTASSRLIEGLTNNRLGEPLEGMFPELAERLLTPTGIAAPDEPITIIVDGTVKHYAVGLASVNQCESSLEWWGTI